MSDRSTSYHCCLMFPHLYKVKMICCNQAGLAFAPLKHRSNQIIKFASEAILGLVWVGFGGL